MIMRGVSAGNAVFVLFLPDRVSGPVASRE